MDATDPNILAAFWSFVPIAIILFGAAIGLILGYISLKFCGGNKAIKNGDDTADPGSITIQIEAPPPSEMEDNADHKASNKEGETSDDTDDHISVHIEPTPTESTPPFEMKDSAWTIVPCHRTTEYITQDKSYFF